MAEILALQELPNDAAEFTVVMVSEVSLAICAGAPSGGTWYLCQRD